MADERVLEGPNLKFVFSIASVKPGAPANYRVERMRTYLEKNGETKVDTDDARFLLMIQAPPPAPLVDPRLYPAASEKVKRERELRMACALQSVERETPLLSGETVESDEFSFLTGAFMGCPERTVGLRRRTNYGEMLYLFPGATIGSDGQLQLSEPPLPEGIVAPAIAMEIDFGSIATKIAGGIASGMLSAVGGAIAGAIIGKIFPPGVPSYFDQVYKEMERIIGAQLQQSIIDQINGAINNVKVHITTEYTPAKVGKDLNKLDDRQFLFNLLQKYETTYLTGPGGMLGTIMADQYAKLGLGIFVLGAGLHLTLFQEMANVDPSNKGADGKFRSPLESSYGRPQSGTIASTAAYYSDFAEKFWPQVLADRRNKIHQWDEVKCIPAGGNGSICHRYSAFKDDLTGDQTVVTSDADKHGNSPARDQLIRDYQAYVDKRVAELTKSLNNPPEITGNWRKLVATPIKVS